MTFTKNNNKKSKRHPGESRDPAALWAAHRAAMLDTSLRWYDVEGME